MNDSKWRQSTVWNESNESGTCCVVSTKVIDGSKFDADKKPYFTHEAHLISINPWNVLPIKLLIHLPAINRSETRFKAKTENPLGGNRYWEVTHSNPKKEGMTIGCYPPSRWYFEKLNTRMLGAMQPMSFQNPGRLHPAVRQPILLLLRNQLSSVISFVKLHSNEWNTHIITIQ